MPPWTLYYLHLLSVITVCVGDSFEFRQTGAYSFYVIDINKCFQAKLVRCAPLFIFILAFLYERKILVTSLSMAIFVEIEIPPNEQKHWRCNEKNQFRHSWVSLRFHRLKNATVFIWMFIHKLKMRNYSKNEVSSWCLSAQSSSVTPIF